MRTAATAQTAFAAPDRSQSPRCPCKAPPKFYHPMVRLHRRGTAPNSICRFGGRLVQNAIGESRRWRAPQLTKWLTPADQRRWRRVFRKLTAALLSPPGSGRAYRPTAAHPRRESARQLNHSPASATNEWVDWGVAHVFAREFVGAEHPAT